MKYAITPTRVKLAVQLLNESKKRGEMLKNFHIPGAGRVTLPKAEEKDETADGAAE